MRFFFRSRQFKIIVAVFSAVIILAVIFRVVGHKMAPTADIAGTVAAPFQSMATKISDFFSNLNKMLSDGNELLLENAKLQSEIGELREQLSDYNEITAQNEFYKDYLGLKEVNPDFELSPATLISRDSDDPYGSFVINQGSSAGISLYDPVITEAGLVGYITDLGSSTAKVTTVLNPNLVIGALDNRTNDSGLVSGTLEYAENNQFDFVCLHKEYSLSNYPDCTVGGTADKICLCCGEIIGTEDISKGTHSYKTKIFGATCTENGFIKSSCTVCGYERTTVTEPATGHTANGSFKIQNSTCAESGCIYKLCDICGESFDEVKIEKLPHTPSEKKTVVTAPTCIEEGEYCVLCKDCGEVLEKGTIPAHGHTKSSEFTVLNDSDYFEDIKGLYIRECTNCHIALDYGEFYKGDLNNDEEINSRDIIIIKKILAGDISYDEEKLILLEFLGDMNNDGEITSRDNIALKKIVRNG